jgi:bifunctional non-homologous end joining protein LigD
LVLGRVHWVRPELVAEVKFLSWTEDNLLRQVVCEGLREAKPTAEVRRSVQFPETRCAEHSRPQARAFSTKPTQSSSN